MRSYGFLKVLGVSVMTAAIFLTGCTIRNDTGDKANAERQLSSEKDKPSVTATDFLATKNTTRVLGTNAEELSISTSKMIWPASANGTKPTVVLLAPSDQWQVQLVATDLIHHPSDGPLLVTDETKVSEEILEELNRLSPKGASDGTQVIAVGMEDSALEGISSQFKIKQIKGKDSFELAAAIDDYFAEVSGELPASVIVSTSENPEYAAPAGNWISHMPEPLLFVKKDEIPEKTRESLKKRNGKANIYLLGPETVISSKVEADLGQYGKVIRIAGKDPISNSIAFAKYKDPATGFGWGITNPGHGLLLGNREQVKEVIPAASFAHRGKHAPLLLTEKDKATDDLIDYLKELKPLFKKEPTEGPYNHLYVMGNEDWISAEQQGDLDHLIEIEAANGMDHGQMKDMNPPDPKSPQNQQHDMGDMKH